MTTGELFFEGDQIPLSQEEILDFRDEELISAINFLAKENFIEGAPIEEALSFIRKTKTLEGWRQIKLEAYITEECDVDDYDEPVEAPRREWVIRLDIEELRNELTEPMVLAATAARGGEVVSEALSSEEPVTISAWEITGYYFGSDDSKAARVYNYYELQDDEGEVLWHDQQVTDGEAVNGPDGPLRHPLDSTEKLKLYNIGNEVSGVLTVGDRHAMRTALVKFGVPSTVFWVEN